MKKRKTNTPTKKVPYISKAIKDETRRRNTTAKFILQYAADNSLQSLMCKDRHGAHVDELLKRCGGRVKATLLRHGRAAALRLLFSRIHTS